MGITQFEFEDVRGIEGLKVITPFAFGDFRGEYRKLYEHNLFETQGIEINRSELAEIYSAKYVLRGLHMQHTKPQSKLVRVISGEVYDVAVDIRKGSKTYGQHFGIHLSAENRKQLFVPEGFLHGFLALADNTVFSYLCGNDYNPGYDGGVIWNDPDLCINWPIEVGQVPILSKKDQNLPTLKEFSSKYDW